MLNSEPKVKLISECFIKPNLEVVGEASKEPFYLSPMDLALLSSNYMQKGLLFAKPSDKDYQTEFLMQKLKHSLSLTLLHFYPLAGRFATKTFSDERACCIFLDCIKGPGARFIHAFLDSNVSDILSCADIHPVVTSFFDLGENSVNHDGHTKALLSFQVTELLDGIFIGISMSHSVGDGSSLVHFLTSLSEIFNSVATQNGGETSSISRKPIFKPFFPEGYGPILKLPFIEPDEFIYRYDPGPLREKIFHFSPESMSRLKSIANNSSKCRHEIEISSFQALACLIWRAVTRARKVNAEMETSCGLPMDIRRRLDPPVSQQHFGNYFTGVTTRCKAGELLGNDLGWGASLLHATVKSMNDEEIQKPLRKFAETPMVIRPGNSSAFFGANFVHIIGSSRFDFFGTDFGMGKPLAFRSGNGGKTDGKVAVIQGRDGVGSVDFEISLVPPTMSALEVDEEFLSFVTVGYSS